MLRLRIVRALSHDGFLSEQAASEAAFHLTDWIYDLHDLHALYNSKRWKPDEAFRLLMAFVAHAPAHLAAAHRIMFDLPVTDVFELGAVKGTGIAARRPGGPWPKRSARKAKKAAAKKV